MRPLFSHAGAGPMWPQPNRDYWNTVARFALLGPLVGGLPWNVMLVFIPFSYVIGFVPALLCGLAYATWWHRPSRRLPGRAWRAGAGALCACLACAAFALLSDRSGPGWWFVVLAAHGVPAGAVLAATQRAPAPATSP